MSWSRQEGTVTLTEAPRPFMAKPSADKMENCFAAGTGAPMSSAALAGRYAYDVGAYAAARTSLMPEAGTPPATSAASCTARASAAVAAEAWSLEPGAQDVVNAIDMSQDGGQRQRHDRPAAHRVHVADRVGGGDAAEVERVVDDRHEEVGRGHQRLLVVQAVHRRVVRRLVADQRVLRVDPGQAGEPLAEEIGPQLRRTAGAGGQRGEAGEAGGEGGHAG